MTRVSARLGLCLVTGSGLGDGIDGKNFDSGQNIKLVILRRSY